MILYDHPLSPFSQKVRIMLREKGLAFTAVVPEGLGSGQDNGFSQQNPRMEVPALVLDDGRTLFDSTIILEYLEDAFSEPAMRPADPFERARCREIEEVCDTHYEAINWGLGELRYFKRGGAKAEAMRAVGVAETRMLHSWLEGQLGAAGWLSGGQFGWADLAAVPYVTMSVALDIAPAEGSPLSAWLARVLERPSVAATAAEASVAVVQMAQYSGVVEAGGFRRHFRDHRLEWMIRAGGIDVVTDGLARDNIRFTDLARFAG